MGGSMGTGFSDECIFNLRGRVLEINFSPALLPTPEGKTNPLVSQVLKTLRVFAAPAPQQQDSATTAGKQTTKTVVYENKKYRFRFVLPESWKGYSILVGYWTGSAWDPEKREKPIREETGPVITIRHPLWTESDPYQDIPIMILTYAQADLSKEGNLSTSAAPYGPQEIARNSKYVFALPPRYNYAIATGVEEVEQLIREHSLRPF